jgi:hypothetical protein
MDESVAGCEVVQISELTNHEFGVERVGVEHVFTTDTYPICA